MSAAAQRGVDEHASATASEELDDFSFENGLVVKVLGHLQPFNRRTGRAGGEYCPLPLGDCQAAHGPRPVLHSSFFHSSLPRINESSAALACAA